MIRCAGRSGRIARIGVYVIAAGAAVAPAAASAQSAVEEYSLDLPGGGSGSSGAGTPSGSAPAATPSAGATASGAPTDTDAGATGAAPTSAGGERATANGSKPQHSQGRDEAAEDLEFGGIHEGTIEALDTSSRSAPEVVADTLLDSAMLPVLGALVLITGFGAWRVLRSRGALSRQVG